VGGGGGSRWDPAAGAPVDWRRTVGIVWSTTTTMTTHRWRRGIIDDDFPAIRGVDVEDLRSPHEAPRTSPPDAGVRPRRPLPRCAEDGGREGGHRNSRWPSSHAPSTGRCRRDGAPATKKKHVLLSLSLSFRSRVPRTAVRCLGFEGRCAVYRGCLGRSIAGASDGLSRDPACITVGAAGGLSRDPACITVGAAGGLSRDRGWAADPRERMEGRTRFCLLFILFSSRDYLVSYYRI
jgi:hypothetical protein